MTMIRATLTLSLAALTTLVLSDEALAKQATAPKELRQSRRPMLTSSAETIIAGGAFTCRVRAASAPQRRACLACVARGGIFPLRRDGRGRCRDLYPAGMSRRPRITSATLRSARQCLAQVQGRKEQRRCLSCVRWGGLFDRRGAGSCRLVRREGIGVRRHYHYLSR